MFFGVCYGPSSEETRMMHEKRSSNQVFSNLPSTTTSNSSSKKSGSAASGSSGFEQCSDELLVGVSREKFLHEYKKVYKNVYFECYDFCGRKKWMVD